MAGKLVINEEGFIDLRRNPPATTVTVQGGLEPSVPRPAVPTLPEPPPEPLTAPLPAIQKTTEGLTPSVAGPVKVVATRQPPKLKRLSSTTGHPCYVLLSTAQYDRLSRYEWVGTRKGFLYRKVKINGNETVVWLHREAARVNRSDQFVGFKDGDERNCSRYNLKICATAAEAREVTRKGRNG